MLGSEEKYTGFPSDTPFISIFHALETCFNYTIEAKEIVAMYVMHSRLWSEPTPYGWENKPIWDIHFYGIEPIIPSSGKYDNIPLEQKTHWRCLLDAKTGAIVREGTLPQPDRIE